MWYGVDTLRTHLKTHGGENANICIQSYDEDLSHPPWALLKWWNQHSGWGAAGASGDLLFYFAQKYTEWGEESNHSLCHFCVFSGFCAIANSSLWSWWSRAIENNVIASGSETDRRTEFMLIRANRGLKLKLSGKLEYLVGFGPTIAFIHNPGGIASMSCRVISLVKFKKFSPNKIKAFWFFSQFLNSCFKSLQHDQQKTWQCIQAESPLQLYVYRLPCSNTTEHRTK